MPTTNQFDALADRAKEIAKNKKEKKLARAEAARIKLATVNKGVPGVSWSFSAVPSEKAGYIELTSLIKVDAIDGADYHKVVPETYKIDINQCFDKQGSANSQICDSSVPANLPVIDSSKPLLQASKTVVIAEYSFLQAMSEFVNEVKDQFNLYLTNVNAPVQQGKRPEVVVPHISLNGTVFRYDSLCLSQVSSMEAATLSPSCGVIDVKNEKGESVVTKETLNVNNKLPGLRVSFGCPVNGTEYALSYDPNTKQLTKIEGFAPGKEVAVPYLAQNTQLFVDAFQALIDLANGKVADAEKLVAEGVLDYKKLAKNALQQHPVYGQLSSKEQALIAKEVESELSLYIDYSVSANQFSSSYQCPPQFLVLDQAKSQMVGGDAGSSVFRAYLPHIAIGLTASLAGCLAGLIACCCLQRCCGCFLPKNARNVVINEEEEQEQESNYCARAIDYFCCFFKKRLSAAPAEPAERQRLVPESSDADIFDQPIPRPETRSNEEEIQVASSNSSAAPQNV